MQNNPPVAKVLKKAKRVRNKSEKYKNELVFIGSFFMVELWYKFY